MSKVIEKNLSYPIGQYQPQPFSIDQKVEWMADIKFLPLQLENAVLNLDESQLHIPYREGGWTVQQVVHHVADSHMNAYIRFKWALTEDNPTIKPYDQAKWAELEDNKAEPMVSIMIITGIHKRWVDIMQHMSASDWDLTLKHPEHNRQLILRMLVLQYAWHGRHHLQHILQCRQSNGF